MEGKELDRGCVLTVIDGEIVYRAQEGEISAKKGENTRKL